MAPISSHRKLAQHHIQCRAALELTDGLQKRSSSATSTAALNPTGRRRFRRKGPPAAGARKLIALPLMPCVVTVLCHANCMGAWVYFWRHCSPDASLDIGAKRSWG
eukprot:2337348-Amphidinium_carterae.2